MSAVFGIIDFAYRTINPQWIKSMQDNLSHRGPDGQGIYEENSIVMGHLLLKVTPESEYENNPHIENGMVITANARLDERETLMDKLNISPLEREQITDPVLLLRSYQKWGKGFVKDIYGDFSFAIWDIEKKQLFCARDHAGVKPFVYYFNDNRFVFSTELKSIVKLPFVATEIDNQYLRNRAIAICDEPQKTSWNNIQRLQPAHTMEIINGQLSAAVFWKPAYKRNKRFKTEEDSADAVRFLLEKIIADHTRVTGNVGASLSGGLDSGTITCIAARKLHTQRKKLITASSVYTPGYSNHNDPDEMEYISAITEQEQNIEPCFVHNSNYSFINGLSNSFKRNYAPVNVFYYVDEALYTQFHLKSVRRVLSGYLGDQTVTNNNINPFPILFTSGRFLALQRLIAQYNKNDNQPIAAFLKHSLLTGFTPKLFQKVWNKYKNREDNSRDVTLLPLILSKKEEEILQKKVSNTFDFPNVSTKDIAHHIWPGNLYLFDEEEDCLSSHHQIEVTYPLCDRRLIELLLQIPVEHFYAGGNKRGLIRKAMTGILPEKIRTRKSKGCYSPGYPVLIKKEISQIIDIIERDFLNSHLTGLIDVKKLKIELKNLSDSKIEDSFTYATWTMIEIIIWLYCSKSLENK